MAKTNVEFWQSVGNKIIYTEDICFRNINSIKLPKRVVYLAPIDEKLNKIEEVIFYLQFLDKILNKDIYKHKIFNSKRYENHAMFTLDCSNLNKRNSIFLYLTAFRYIDEYCEILKELYKSKDETDIDKLFLIFQKIHHDHDDLKKAKRGNLSGHGLISNYFRNGFNPISLEEFQDNLKNQSSQTVQGFFNPSGVFKLGDKYKNLKIGVDKVVDKY